LKQLRARIVECRTGMAPGELKWHARLLCEEMLGVNRIGPVKSSGTNGTRGPAEVEVGVYVVADGDEEKAREFFDSLTIDMGGRLVLPG
jgi:hypothetical protein